ncbi:MAG: SDR family NAD(P)-dependent oxidoreductase [Sumerlaeia bacterium]
MARTILENRIALILGIDSAPGRACAQQLSRLGCRVLLASRASEKVQTLTDQLQRKGGNPSEVHLSRDTAQWQPLFRSARDNQGHIHVVVNALALCYDEDGLGETAARALEEAKAADIMAAELLDGHGPLKMISLCPEGAIESYPTIEGVWHGIVELGPYQRLDSQSAKDLDATGIEHLKAGGIGDAVTMLLHLPPTTCPARLRLEAVASSEKKGKG